MDPSAIVRHVLRGYALDPMGPHGVEHWARVLENGLRLAEETGADARVVTLFALFHDSRRVNDIRDPGHGRRGGDLALSLRGTLFELEDEACGLLHTACDLHTAGHTEADLTVRVCWDADRLDLGRVGITPLPSRLCTDAARALIPWADRRAVEWHRSPLVDGWLGDGIA